MTAPTTPVACPHCGACYRVPDGWLGKRVACRRCGKEFGLSAPRHSAPGQEAASGSDAPPGDAPDLSLCRLAVRFRMLSAGQLELACERHARQPPETRPSLQQVLVDDGLLTPGQLAFLASAQQVKEARQADQRFGELAVEDGLATAEQVAQAMEEQKRRFVDCREKVLIGDVLVAQGVLTPEQREALLALQHRLHMPSPETSETRLAVTVAEDRLAAFVTWEGGPPPTADALAEALERRGIVFGVDHDALEAIGRGAIPAGEAVAIARGRAPKAPVNARLEYLFETRAPIAGREGEDGHIDFRDRGDIPQVAAGDPLVRKLPGVDGEPGTDVLGRSLPAAAPKEVTLSAGKGAELSDDKRLVTATDAGRPSLSALGIVSVYPEYRVDGDIGYETGHVDFHGRVVVKGAVQKGFRVRCGELVAGEVQEAEVEAEGNVSVAGGIIGGRVHAGGDLRAHFLQKARIEVLGEVVVDKEAVDSLVACGGVFNSPRCTLISSEIVARQGVYAEAVGSDVAAPSRLTVGNDECVAREAARIEAAVAALKASAVDGEEREAKLNARLSQLEQLVGEQAQEQDRTLVRQRELQQSLSAMENAGLADKAQHFRDELAGIAAQVAAAEQSLGELFDEQDRLTEILSRAPEQDPDDQEIAALRDQLQHLKAWQHQQVGRAVVQVGGTLHPHTIIKTPHGEVRLKGERRHVRLEERLVRDEKGRMRWRLGVASWQAAGPE